MMMKNGGDLKNIKAMMTVGAGLQKYGFKNRNYGSLSPNPLPNGVLVTDCHASPGDFFLEPSSIKSCTINDVTFNDGTGSEELYSYLRNHKGKTIPVIFHFD